MPEPENERQKKERLDAEAGRRANEEALNFDYDPNGAGGSVTTLTDEDRIIIKFLTANYFLIYPRNSFDIELSDPDLTKEFQAYLKNLDGVQDYETQSDIGGTIARMKRIITRLQYLIRTDRAIITQQKGRIEELQNQIEDLKDELVEAERET